jgi:hypothetical protein
MGETTTGTEAKASGAGAEERIHDPIHHASYRFEREGANLWVYTWLGDGGHLPEHFHPSTEERWEALDGTARLKLAGVWRDLAPADGPVLVAPNVRHELANRSGREVSLRTEVIPGGRLDELLTESAWGAREGLYNARNLPTSVRGAVWVAALAQRFRDETVMCSPPPAVQRLVLPLVARFAR